MPLPRRGLIGVIVACLGFGAIMLATRLDKLGEAAVLGGTSAVFAALIAGAVPVERVWRQRVPLNAVVTEFAEWG